MTLRVTTVEGRRGMARFIDVPWHIYDPGKHPQWVPPLRAQVRDTLDRKKNPFFRDADMQLWVAERDGRPVGRIAAIENRAHNRFHHDRVGFFGFFECIESQEVADALFDAAAAWLRGKGLEAMRGPMNPSTNYDCGTLVRGFRWQPSFLTTWNPRYYPELIEGAGLAGVKDLVSYFIPADTARMNMPESLDRVVDRVHERTGIRFRSVDLGDFPAEVERVWEVYSDAWEKNWGFVPVSRAEFDHIAGDLRHLLVEDFVFFAEVGDETVGFMLIAPDLNFVLKKIPDGRLFPTGLLKLLLGKKKVKIGRIMAAGIKEPYRNRGVFQLFVQELQRRGEAYDGIGVDASWILEDNRALRDPIEQFGAKVTRRWRIYERAVAPTARRVPESERPTT